MKVRIDNWGPIEHCEYDLDKDMIVVYGDNNIGKSYAMQLIYLYLKNIINYAKNIGMYRPVFYSRENTEVEKFVMGFAMDDNQNEVDITDEIIKCMASRLKTDMVQALDNSLRNTFGTYDDIIEGNPRVSLQVNNGLELLFFVKEQKISIKLDMKPVFLKKTSSDFHKSREGKKRLDIYIFKNNKISSVINLINDKVYSLLSHVSVELLSRVQNVYFLPASRSGIYTGMNSFGPILAELSKNRAYIKGNLQIPSISEPISDYYMELSTIRIDRRKYFTDVAQEIEDEILKGEVTFDTKKKTIMYQSDLVSQPMEMRDVSSMVSEISPITAYLKYIVNVYPTDFCVRNEMSSNEGVRPSDIIFIEEPEAHLHPENQVKLMKIFARLVNKNVKLFMASHSNYVFNELNNRILAGELNNKNYEPVLMEYKDGKSCTRDMNIDEFGVDDNNFQDITAQIIEEREVLINGLLKKMSEKGE